MIFAHAKIGLDKLLFAFYAFLRFTTTIHRWTLNSLCRIGRFNGALSSSPERSTRQPSNLVGPVEISEVYVIAGPKGRERDRSRSRGLSTRGRGSYAKDKSPVSTPIDCSSE